jgi:hypothetical protein
MVLVRRNAQPQESARMSPDQDADDRAPAHGHRQALDAALLALDDAETRRRPVDMVQALARVGRGYQALGEAQAAEWYLQQALRWARTLGGVDASVDLLCDLAEVAVTTSAADGDAARGRAARDRARDHGFEAAAKARQCADPQWETRVLLRVSDVLDRCGDHEDALALQCRALELMAAAAMPAAEPAARAA